jgi:dCMP deaminase
MGFQTEKSYHRPSKQDWFMKIAHVVAERGTCARRQVGCVVVDIFSNIMSTGYNGPARGMKHCIDVPCAGATAESGKDLDTCEAIHAEVNAISQCSDIQKIAEIYCTTAPCVSCTKVLLNTGALRIFFTESYAQAEQAKHLWCQSHPQREWIHLHETEEK